MEGGETRGPTAASAATLMAVRVGDPALEEDTIGLRPGGLRTCGLMEAIGNAKAVLRSAGGATPTNAAPCRAEETEEAEEDAEGGIAEGEGSPPLLARASRCEDEALWASTPTPAPAAPLGPASVIETSLNASPPVRPASRVGEPGREPAREAAGEGMTAREAPARPRSGPAERAPCCWSAESAGTAELRGVAPAAARGEDAAGVDAAAVCVAARVDRTMVAGCGFGRGMRGRGRPRGP